MPDPGLEDRQRERGSGLDDYRAQEQLDRWLSDLRLRGRRGLVTPPPSTIDVIERLIEQAADDKLRGVAAELQGERDALWRAIRAYVEDHGDRERLTDDLDAIGGR